MKKSKDPNRIDWQVKGENYFLHTERGHIFTMDFSPATNRLSLKANGQDVGSYLGFEELTTAVHGYGA